MVCIRVDRPSTDSEVRVVQSIEQLEAGWPAGPVGIIELLTEEQLHVL